MENENQKHVDMIKNPDRWPLWPRLPLKHKTERGPEGLPRCAFLIDAPSGPLVLYFGYIIALHPDSLLTKVFRSPEELVEAGWMVD